MNRRRFLRLSGCAIAGLSASPSLFASKRLKEVKIRGFALGAEGSLSLFTDNPSQATKDIQTCFSEIHKLEKIFSLYDRSSEISKLNKTGILKNPSSDWKKILKTVSKVNLETGALFDPTVQPYWISQQALNSENKRLKAPIGWQHVDYSGDQIEFRLEGVKITLNGIAQGYITDRLTEILMNLGYKNALVQMGETRSVGLHASGRPWKIGLPKTNDTMKKIKSISLSNGEAIATSGDDQPINGKGHHFHPKSGSTKTLWSSMTVIASNAMEADAYSTGLMFADKALLTEIESRNSELKIIYSA